MVNKKIDWYQKIAYRKTGRKTHQSKIQKNKKTSFVFVFCLTSDNNKSQICLFRSHKYEYQILSFKIQFCIWNSIWDTRFKTLQLNSPPTLCKVSMKFAGPKIITLTECFQTNVKTQN